MTKQPTKNDTLGLLLIWIAIAWAVFLVDTVAYRGLLGNALGVVPRTASSALCIFSMPFLHATLSHLLTNTIGFIVLGGLVAWTRREQFHSISFIIVLLSGIGVWLFARSGTTTDPAVHVGASGVIFGYIGFLVTEVVRFRERNILIGAIAIVMFTTMFSGMLPGGPRHVSWEGHLFGCLAGIAASFCSKPKTKGA